MSRFFLPKPKSAMIIQTKKTAISLIACILYMPYRKPLSIEFHIYLRRLNATFLCTKGKIMAKKKPLNQKQKQDKALEMYLNTDLSQKDICEIIGWTEATFTKNKERHGWDSLKGASTITSANIIKKLYIRLEDAVDADKLDSDALIKITKSIEYLSNKKVTVSHHINCAKEFTIWLFAKKPELAKDLNKYQKDFINQLVSNG